MILELKSKFAKLYPDTDGIPDAPAAPKKTSATDTAKLSDAKEALAVLGYSRSEIVAALKNASMDDSLEDIIKKALAQLMK